MKDRLLDLVFVGVAVAVVWFGFGCDSRTIYHNVTGPTVRDTVHDTVEVLLPHHHGKGK